MPLPLLFAAEILSEATPITIGAAVLIGGLIVGSVVGWVRTESKVTTLSQDQNNDRAATKEGLEKVTSILDRKAEQSQKDRDDMRERIQSLERKEGRADERVAGIERTLAQQNRTLEKMDGKLDDLLTAERDSLRRRKTDAA